MVFTGMDKAAELFGVSLNPLAGGWFLECIKLDDANAICFE